MRGEEESLERRLRGEYEALYRQKCQSYCAMLEGRYETLREAIDGVYKHIMADEVLAAMLNDRTTSAHVHERVKEVFSEVITHEREIIFKKLGTQITNLKFENEQLQREVDRLRDSQQNLEKNFTTERQTLEKTSSSASEELRRAREELGRTKEELRRAREELEMSRGRAEKAGEENGELRMLVQNMKEQLEGTGRDQEEALQLKMKLRQAEGNVEELKALLRDSQDKAERKLQAKRKEYKQKIDSYKTVITQINHERLETEEAVRRQEGEQASLHMERRVATLLKDHERKLGDLRQAKDRERAELERTHQARLREYQAYFEKLLEQRVAEVEENAAKYFERMRAELADENYLPRATCEEEIGKRDEIMLLMKSKLEQFEAVCEDYQSRNDALAARLKEAEAALTAAKQKHSQLDDHSQQLTAKLKSYEQANNIFKLGDQKSRDQFAEYERLLKKAREEQEDAKQVVIRLEHERGQNEGLLREKERRIKDALEENEVQLRKIRKLTETVEEEGRIKEGLSATIGELRKELAGAEFKVKEREMTAALSCSSWEGKAAALQVEAKEKGKLLADLQEKYQEVCAAYQEEKRKNYEIDASIKKYELENRYYREAADMQKGQSATAIDEYKRILQDKNEKLAALNAELDRKNGKMVEVENELKHQREKNSNEGKRMATKLKKLGKLMGTQLDSLRKENLSIVHYLKTRVSIQQNDDSILRSTFNKQLVHLHLMLERQKELIVRNTKAESTEAANTQAKVFRRQFQDKMKEANDRTETEKDAMKATIRQRQNKIEEMMKEQKRLSCDLKKESQQSLRLQRELDLVSRRSQKEKEGLEAKLQEMLREMKEERDIIVKQYEDKRYALEQEVQNLASSLKRLKIEAESIQAKHEEEKAAINAQLRTVREQEEVIQRVAQQKDQEISRISRDYEASLQSKRQLESQSRSYADALAKKVQALHDLEIQQHQQAGELGLLRNKCERMGEENSELRRKMAQREEELEESARSRARFESELKDIKGALSRSSKNQELRALNELSMETLQLSQKVNEMRKVSNYLDGKTPLRS